MTNQVRSSVDNDLWLPRTKLTLREKMLPYSGATLYNGLPLETRQSSSVSSFKTLTLVRKICTYTCNVLYRVY